MLPLDVGNKGNFDRMLTWLKDQGYEILSDFAMGLSVEQIKNCPDADLNPGECPIRSGCRPFPGVSIWNPLHLRSSFR